jgi:hypothetical protein
MNVSSTAHFIKRRNTDVCATTFMSIKGCQSERGQSKITTNIREKMRSDSDCLREYRQANRRALAQQRAADTGRELDVRDGRKVTNNPSVPFYCFYLPCLSFWKTRGSIAAAPNMPPASAPAIPGLITFWPARNRPGTGVRAFSPLKKLSAHNFPDIREKCALTSFSCAAVYGVRHSGDIYK